MADRVEVESLQLVWKSRTERRTHTLTRTHARTHIYTHGCGGGGVAARLWVAIVTAYLLYTLRIYPVISWDEI